jgi:protocatechuate 3,4-dioxygenase beta subunit
MPRKRSKPVLFLAGVFTLVLFTELSLALPAETRGVSHVTFRGSVHAKDGSPLVGAAVVVESAVPREGISMLSFGCYPDSLKSVLTDEAGNFAIPDVDDRLDFNLWIAKAGYEPKRLSEITLRRENVEIELGPPRFTAPSAKRRIFTGRLVDKENKPIAGALVIPKGNTIGNNGLLGPMDKMASVQISDSAGEFKVTTAKEVDSLDIEVKAKGFVPRYYKVSGEEALVLSMQRGATLRGRVVQNGRPVPHAVIGLVWNQRFSGNSWGPFESMTDETGQFAIHHVTPEKKVYLYGKMRSLIEIGAVKPIEVTTCEDEGVMDVGELNIVNASTVSGHVLLSTGLPLSPGSTLNLAAADLWDHQMVNLPPDGSFEIKGVPPWICSVSVMISPQRGDALSAYRPSALNASLHPIQWILLGRVDADTELTIPMEPGDQRERPVPNTLPEVQLLRQRMEKLRTSPLQGIPRGNAEKL